MTGSPVDISVPFSSRIEVTSGTSAARHDIAKLMNMNANEGVSVEAGNVAENLQNARRIDRLKVDHSGHLTWRRTVRLLVQVKCALSTAISTGQRTKDSRHARLTLADAFREMIRGSVAVLRDADGRIVLAIILIVVGLFGCGCRRCSGCSCCGKWIWDRSLGVGRLRNRLAQNAVRWLSWGHVTITRLGRGGTISWGGFGRTIRWRRWTGLTVS